MGRIIAIANQKGGVGKTTTAINLSACLAEAKQRVLVIDIDPQGNTTSGLGIDKEEKENTIYEVMLGEISIEQAICKEAFDCLDVIPSNVNLADSQRNDCSRHSTCADSVRILCIGRINTADTYNSSGSEKIKSKSGTGGCCLYNV